MAARRWWRGVALAALTLGLAGCFDEPPIPDPGVPIFGDAFTVGLEPNAFQGSLLTSLTTDTERAHSGAASIKLQVPASSSGFSGGAVLATDAQDLSATNALVFWVVASRAATFDKIGFGLNYAPHPSTYQVTLLDLALTTEWTRHLIPIPDASKLTAERGMLWYADADPGSYTAWLDEVRFDHVDPGVMQLAPEIGTASATIGIAGTAQVGGLALRYRDFDGTERVVDSATEGSGPAVAYWEFRSSNPAVATVDPEGEITGVGSGQATITARLGGLDAAGAVTVTVADDVAPTSPTTAPPAPTLPQTDVISLLSSAYTNVPVDTWGAPWSNGGAGANVTDLTVGGSPLKKYPGLQFAGIEFVGTAGAREIDATSMTHLHVDVWTPDATVFKVKLVDFGADRTYLGGDDREHELSFGAATSPALAIGEWVSFDVPLSSFTGLTTRAHLAQLVLSSSTATVFVGNVYFHD